MNLRQAAQQALEALEESIDTVRNEYESDWRHGVPTREKQLSAMRELVEKHEAAINALRTALAEPRKHISYVCPQCHWTLDTNPVDDTALLRKALEALEYEAQRGNDDAYRSLRDALSERLGEKA